MQFLTAPSEAGELVRFFLLMAFPIACGLFFCIKSPLAKGGQTRCAYCKQHISVSASVCPYCRRKVGSSFLSPFKSRFAQFLIGLFLGTFLEILLIVAVFKLMTVIF